MTLYQVRARVREWQYGDDVYMVTVVKPEGIGDLIDEEGTLMEHGKFSFDLTEKIARHRNSKSRLQESGRRPAFFKRTRSDACPRNVAGYLAAERF